MKTNILALSAALLLCGAASVSCSDQGGMLPDRDHLARKFDSKDRKLFISPEKVHYPQTWFHFIGGNVSYEGITADLEAIADAGISGVHFFHGQQGGKWPATGEDIECMSEKWEDAVKFVAEECERLGLNFTIQNCPGWAMSGGPWIKPENAMRILVSSSQIVKGCEKVSTALAQPQPSREEWRDYRDIAVLAFPTPVGAADVCPTPKKIDGCGDYEWQKPIAHNQGITLQPAREEANWVEISYDKPTVIRTLQLSSVQGFDHAMCYDPGVTVKVYAYDRKGNSTKILDAPMPQSNWQDNAIMSLACEVVEDAVKYRVEIENQYNMHLSRLNLLSMAMKNSWESEAGWTLRSPERTADDVLQPAEAYLKYDQIVDVTEYFSTDGRFEWTPPTSGDWTIMRLGHVNAGRKNAPAPPSGTGWECDKLSTDGPEAHFAGYVGKLSDGVLGDGLLNGMLLDSWECQTQTWTLKMEEEFERVSGYELRRWLPAVLGYVVDDPQTTSRFLLDWRTTIGDLFSNKFYRRMAELGHQKGLVVTYETAAGDVFPADIMEYFKYADIPMCEFWHPFSHGYVGDINFKPIMPTASAARLYGKPRVAAESFTSFNLTWDEQFSMLKEVADYHYVEGVTYNVFHTYTHNPQIDFKQPGTSFGARIGTPFLRGQTWWKHMPKFTTYLARCSYMLERGQSTLDVLWYLGDEISHKPSQKFQFPAGYKYDYCNPDVLLNRLSVEDGEIVTPEGLRYRMMWIPDTKRMLPETLEKLQQMIQQGAVVVADAPKGVATLRGGEDAEKRFAAAVEAIWGNTQAGEITAVGEGKVLSGMTIDKALAMLDMQADVVGNIRWLHRRTEGADWYFVIPEKESSFKGDVKFHATGRVELWNPTTGEMLPVASSTDGEYTTINLDLPRYSSYFVVFETNKKPHKVEPSAAFSKMLALDKEWTVEFPDGWGAPAKMTTVLLKSWQDLIEDEEGRSFSGTATYTTTFNLDEVKRGQCVELDLGKVSMIAVVKVNGEEVDTLWYPPYKVDIADYVQSGENTLTVEVTSTWHNRLVYDAGRPEEERKTWTIAGPGAGNGYHYSGLMGEVYIRY